MFSNVEPHNVSQWAICTKFINKLSRKDKLRFFKYVHETLTNFINSADPEVSDQHLPSVNLQKDREATFVKVVSTSTRSSALYIIWADNYTLVITLAG